mgnify:CR=1 FL=1|jgi:pyruvate dehydrogenase E1 component beta subunit
MKALTIVQSVNHALALEMRANPDIVVFGEDVGLSGGVFRATENLQKEFGERRCFDTPLAESGIAGTAIGMAIAGLRPVIEMQFSGFAWPAMNQLLSHAARFRNRTRGAMSCPLVVRMPYGGGIRALEHHVESMEAIWGHIPGLKVVIPSTPYDTAGLLIAAIRDPDPVIFMEPKRVYRSFKQEVPDKSYTLPIGKARVVQAGSDITLVGYGAMMAELTIAVHELEEHFGIHAELIDLRTIYPYDFTTVASSVRKTGRLLVVHEGPHSFGVGAELIARTTSECFTSLQAPPSRLTGSDTIFPLPRGEQLYMIESEEIINKVRELVSYIP